MKNRLAMPLFAISCALIGGSSPMLAFEDNAKSKADNTRVNKRDREKGAVTADQAKETLTDRQLMQKIRKSVMNDKSLSTYAHNVKIIATNGKVTLKGPVRSEEEKRVIETKAAEVAGSGNVVNELTIAADKHSSTKPSPTRRG